jgi:light-regulated signal transduction histidine kinase (bacteriophytochrome)
MNTLIQDLLQLSRAGRVEFEEKQIDLNRLFKMVLQDLELKIKETNSEIKVPQLPMVRGDMTQLGRVFQNLLTNALKFKSDKKPVINIEAEEKGNMIEISVSDNGIGIEKQYHQQIFSAFKRLHTRGQYEGTGIGLAICKKIVERHGGKIQLESEPGKGSKFKVQLRKN